MAKTIRQLYEERAKVFEDTKKLMSEDGTFRDGATEESYNLGMQSFNALTGQIERRETTDKIEANMAENALRQSEENGQTRDQNRDTSEAGKRAFTNWLRIHNGFDPRSDEDRRLNAAMIRNAQATTPGTAGGYLVPPLFEQELLIASKAYFDFSGVATEITTATGAPLPWPTTDDTARRAKIIGENTQIGTGNLTFGTTSLNAYLYATDAILVPWTLMQDSFIDLDGFIRDRFAEAFGRTLADHFTTGTGNGMPQGVLTAAPVGYTTPAGETAGVTYDDIVELQHALDPSYRQGAQMMFNDSTLKALRHIKDTQGRPLWVPSYIAGIPDQFANANYIINQSMPNLGPGNIPILYGNFKAYIIRTVKGVTIVRLNERYADYLQTGYFAYARFGGGLPTAGKPIVGLQNAAA